MNRKKMEKRIKTVVKNCSKYHDRSLFFILGEKAYNQVPILHRILCKGKAISLLWCYKEQQKQIKHQNYFESQEISHFKPHYCCYSDIHRVKGESFNMTVMADFEAFTPYLLAFVNETVKRGGMIVILLDKINTLNGLCNFKMDLHINYYNIDSDQSFVSRFNKRLALSLSTCSSCVVLDDNLNIIKDSTAEFISEQNRSLVINQDLKELKEDHHPEDIIDVLINQCQTLEQRKLLSKFLDVLKKRTMLHSKNYAPIAVSSPQGCGKSAALGLAIAGSLVLNYSNIFVSSLCINNTKTLFSFLLRGLDALGYKENDDYNLIQSVNPELNYSLVGLDVFKDHPQAIRFIRPRDVEDKLQQAELVVIDDAAAIPFHFLKHLLGSYVVLMASTTSGYGATGCSLLNNVSSIVETSYGIAGTFQDSIVTKQSATAISFNSGSRLNEVILTEPIHYSISDSVKNWMNRLLCLEPSFVSHLSYGCPEPQLCKLYYISRDVLFSYRSDAEVFLQYLSSLFNSCKRQNTADYLIRMADVPNHHIFCLLPPSFNARKISPEILCAILVHIDHEAPQNIVHSGTNQKQPLSHCLSSWTSETKLFEESLLTAGVHILDLVTHPEFQKMGYGLKALQLLQEFYEGKFISLEETPEVHFNTALEKDVNSSQASESSQLLIPLSRVQPDNVKFFLVSYGLTSNVLRFWKKAGFVPMFITKEYDSYGEQLCFMLKGLDNATHDFKQFLQENSRAFHEYFYILLSSDCKSFTPSLALNLVTSSSNRESFSKGLTKEDIDIYIKPHNMKSLEKYSENLGDLHCIMPIIPIMSKLYFRHCLKDISLSYVQEAVLLCMGLQRKTVDEISKELGLPSSQVLGLLNRTIRKIAKYLADIIEKTIEKTMATPSKVVMEPLGQDLNQELEEAAKKIREQQIDDKRKLMDTDFSQYAIKGTEDEWQKALQSGRKTLVSIKSIKKKPEDDEYHKPTQSKSFKAKNNHAKAKKR